MSGVGDNDIILRRTGDSVEMLITTEKYLGSRSNVDAGLVPVTYRLDDGRRVRQTWHLSTGDTAVIYPGNAIGLARQIGKSRRFSVEIPPVYEGSSALTFDVSSLPDEFFQ